MKKYWEKNRIAVIVAIVVIGTCVLLAAKNWNERSFFTAGLTDLITILLGLIITFFITEKLTDQRRRNDCIEHIIVEIESFVTEDKNFEIDKCTYIKQGSCANRIKYLKDAGFADIKEDIEFIETNFQNIRDLYSNHNQNEESLKSVKVDIDRHRINIVDKCSKIRIGLYSELKLSERS